MYVYHLKIRVILRRKCDSGGPGTCSFVVRWEFLFIMKIKCGVSVWSVDEGSGMSMLTGGVVSR